MEVHHHTTTLRKKWAHYFWEFLMLFLAVFCGFLAENQREHFIEGKREKKYIISLINDLSADTFSLTRIIRQQEQKFRRTDSLIVLLVSGKHKELGNETYLYARGISWGAQFISSDGTMQQLKNAGALRLIKKHSIADSIIAYDKAVRRLQNQVEADVASQERFRLVGAELFRADIFYHIMDSVGVNPGTMIMPTGNPQLLTDDSKVVNKVVFQVQYVANTIRANVSLEQRLKIQATSLIYLLREEYDLK